MATWHQQKAGPIKIDPSVITLISDAPNQMMSVMTFGQNAERARESLKMHRINQPNLNHWLMFEGKPFPEEEV